MNTARITRFSPQNVATAIFLLLLLCTIGCEQGGSSSSAVVEEQFERESPFQRVEMNLVGADGEWIGNGIGYSPFRDGEGPGDEPNPEGIREDLQLLVNGGWRLFRTYGADSWVSDVIANVRRSGGNVKVLMGIWIEPTTSDEAIAHNENQIAMAATTANLYPDAIAGIVVGNETQVSWSTHKVDQGALVQYVRDMRSQVDVPVGVADDFTYWITPESKPLAEELDFIVTHIYAMWHAQPLDNAIAFTQEKLQEVKDAHPEMPIFLGEAGWATQKAASGDQADRLQGEAGEEQQAQFFAQFQDWVSAEQIPSSYFVAFDENWKGGDDPADAEKHWGIYHTDRTPKLAAATADADETSSSEEAAPTE